MRRSLAGRLAPCIGRKGVTRMGIHPRNVPQSRVLDQSAVSAALLLSDLSQQALAIGEAGNDALRFQRPIALDAEVGHAGSTDLAL